MSTLRGVLTVLCLATTPIPACAQAGLPGRFDEPSLVSTRSNTGEVLRTAWQDEPASVAPQDGNPAGDGSLTPPAWSAPAPAAASIEGPASTSGTWWVIAPYAWIPGINGQITTFGVTRNVQIDTSDVLDQLHNANGALQLHLESGRGPLGLILDTNIIRLSESVAIPAGNIGIDLQQTLVELLGMCRLVDVPTEWSKQQTSTVELLGGMRYYNFFNGVTLTPAGSPLTSVPLSQSATWVDLVVGVRGRAPLLPGLDAFARGDIGGFGMGTSSTLAWNVIAGLSWQTTEHLSLVAGYRDFDINAAQGSGTTRFAFHAKMQGPFIAFALQY